MSSSAPASTIADGATIRAFCHIEGATSRRGEHRAVCAAPARHRIGERAKVGNFVEVKKAEVGKGAKANHLTYLGDAEVGARRQHRRRHDHLQL